MEKKAMNESTIKNMHRIGKSIQAVNDRAPEEALALSRLLSMSVSAWQDGWRSGYQFCEKRKEASA